jgi:6-phosphogluconate dehydrogenase
MNARNATHAAANPSRRSAARIACRAVGCAIVQLAPGLDRRLARCQSGIDRAARSRDNPQGATRGAGTLAARCVRRLRQAMDAKERPMQLGMIGLGRMGANMAQRLHDAGHEVIGFDPQDDARRRFEQGGARSAASLADLAKSLSAPRVLWLMVPAGQAVDDTIAALRALLQSGDIVVDGGNSNYKDTLRRARELAADGVHYLDCGTSGGVWGLKEGYSLMIGGDADACERLRPVFEALAPARDSGWGRVGPSGSGHFVKMVHNGIEYGMMQAYAEGFSVLEHKHEFALDLQAIAEIWRSGSVVRSWLLDLVARALKENPGMQGIAPYVADSGEGRWTVNEAIDLDVPAPVITLALIERLRSRDADSFADKLLAAMRHQFGGHPMKVE